MVGTPIKLTQTIPLTTAPTAYVFTVCPAIEKIKKN